MRMFKWYWIMVALGCFGMGVIGCAGLQENGKGFIGISTKILEEKRIEAISQTFDYGYDTCYRKVEKILAKRGSYVYARKRDLIAVYLSEADTTPVGIFFKTVEPAKTQIEVSSASTYAKETISKIIFENLNPAKQGKAVELLPGMVTSSPIDGAP